MDREEFLSKLGMGAAFALTYGCLRGCTREPLKGPPDHILVEDALPGDVDVDFTIDLNDPNYSLLKWPEGYKIIDNVVVANAGNEGYLAASRICSDEILPGIIYIDGEWYCTEHDATFDHQGTGTLTYNNKGKRGLRIYTTELNGNLLRIYS